MRLLWKKAPAAELDLLDAKLEAAGRVEAGELSFWRRLERRVARLTGYAAKSSYGVRTCP